MILSVHMLVGAAIGTKIQNLGLVFILALASHFLLDRLPHWDYVQDIAEELKNRPLSFLMKVLIDFSIGLIFLWLVFGRTSLSAPVFLGAITGALPDFLAGLGPLFKRWHQTSPQSLEKYISAHENNHNSRKASWNFLNVACEATLTVIALIILLT